MRILNVILILWMAVWALAQSPAELQRRREAVRRVAERAEDGDPEALYQLSSLHEMGYDSIPRDSVRSLQLLTLAAEAGYAPAANLLGFKLIRGEGIEKDARKGMQWIEKAAEADDPKALSNIGYLLLHGDDIEHDESKAAYWLTRAADKGITSAQSMLGDLYRDGKGVDRDSLKASSLYRLAFDNGLTDAAYKLYDMTYSQTDTLNAAAKIREGLYYFNRTAPSVGLKFFREVADSLELGQCGLTPELRAQAKALIGDAYSRGRGVEYDYGKTISYYLDAARLGNPSAAFVIGEMLEIFPDALSDYLLPDDPEEYASAAFWLEEASKADIRDASEAMRRLHN
ncbi:MAG: sel1 repeat family protein [Muribaculaceae bacterium]|nr:sel1 repeat family protein [Muribaculaceae bacterium]